MFTTDSRTENFLTSLGVKYEYKSGIKFPVEFKKNWNTENIGRPVAVRDDAVLEYAALMDSGSAAPSPILSNTEDGYRVLDGVQRLSAAELQQITRVSAYVVDTDSEDMLAAVRVLANARMQGRAEPAEWTRRRAVEILVIQRGMTHAEVAQMGGWKASDIKRIAESIELQERITNAGGPELSDAMLAELRPHIISGSALEQAMQPVVGFLQTLKQSRLSASDAVPYIQQFFAGMPRTSNPFKAYTERLEEIHEDPEMQARLTGRAITALSKDVVLLRALKTADTVLTHIVTHGESVANIDEYFRILDKITKQLKSIAPYKKAQTVRVPADMWSEKQ